ncbi:MAG TPA: IS21-like element helper ATPase IstB [Bacteroidales bacterium]|nr:IS21-like element helper ATPase IstB [Bacteroidales bacterium]
MNNRDINQQVDKLSRALRLPAFRKEYLQQASQATTENLPYEEYLLRLMEREYITREENRRKTQIRQAGFPQFKYLHDLKREDLPTEAAAKLPLLERLDFIRDGQNIILSGNPGTGKTHLATGLGIKACQEGYKVLFTTVSRLLTQVRESRSQKILRALENRFEKYDLVICDEFGYISFDKEGAELLFNHLSLRCGRKSTIITTNLSFDRWSEIFGDTVLTAAMVDRLTHRSIMINMNGKSFRVKETKLMMEK